MIGPPQASSHSYKLWTPELKFWRSLPVREPLPLSTYPTTNRQPATSDTWQKQCAYHALATLEVGNLSCIPVYYGSTYPLINTYERFQAWEAIHGVLPWEGVFAPYNATAEAAGFDPTANATNANRIVASAFVEGYPNITAVEGKSAAQFMVEQVKKYPGQVSIYAAGAMTNIALAVRLDEDFASLE